jgi:hypothetical protein
MKLTKSQLKKIIKEELEALISEESECSPKAVKDAKELISKCGDEEEDTRPSAPASSARVPSAPHQAAPRRVSPGDKLRDRSGRVVTMAEDIK